MALQTDKDGFVPGVGRAPLAPVALSLTAGILVDRAASVPLLGSLFAATVTVVAFGISGKSGVRVVYLFLAFIGFGAAFHHYRRDVHPADDVGRLVEDGRRIVQLRGVLDDEPRSIRRERNDPLRSPMQLEREPTFALLVVRQVRDRDDWLAASGRVQVFIDGPMDDVHAGDDVEIVGTLDRLDPPHNPGERDHETELRDDGVRAALRVRTTKDVVVLRDRAGVLSPVSWRAAVRGWGNRTLNDALPRRQGALASALLLGDGSSMVRSEWDRYIHTGVIHVLVVSGQHLAVLGGFVLVLIRLTPMRSRTALSIVVLVLWSYAFLTGARPSVVRAAVTLTMLALAQMLRRPPHPMNALAAAWLVVLILNPCDVNDLGCLLSFACVGTLYWLAERERGMRREPDPLELLVDSARPAWVKMLRGVGRAVASTYFVGFVLWLVVSPLTVSRMHFLSLTGLLVGPPVILLTSIALVLGFLLLLSAILVPFLTPPFALLVSWSLSLCDVLVDFGADMWTRQGYVNGLPAWWLIAFYLFLGLVFLAPTIRRHVVLAVLAWVGVGAAVVLVRVRPDGLQMTFLAVEHGGCTVIETADGRVLLYDVGSMRGSSMVRSRIAPFLWSRGIRRIDEVFLSHADLDHFNGLVELLDRFPVAQVTHTPSFAIKDNPAVNRVLDSLEARGVSRRIVHHGDRLSAGDVQFDVLHPAEEFRDGNENSRSMVLLVRHGRHRILLTGDLEAEGMTDLLAQRPRRVDVLMAPHHGSRTVEPEALLHWARPSLVVSCQGERPPYPGVDPYGKGDFRFLPTRPHGAVIVHSRPTGLLIETFATRERFTLRERDE